MTIYLIVGFLVLVAIAVATLVFAVMRAEEGYEDASGYHSVAQSQTVGTTPPVEGSENPWDYIPGANCPVELTHSLGPMGNNQLSIHR